jgi:GTPase Era involved in 16S rRNA processing
MDRHSPDILSATNIVLSKREAILDEIATIYTQAQIGLLAVADLPPVRRHLREKIFQPQRKVIVLIAGGHSSGKSSFVNWFFGDDIQKVSAAIETSKITFITTGRKRQSFDGTSTLRLFDFLESYQFIPHFVENLQTEMRLPIEERSSLVTLIDTPGLIPDTSRLPFDYEKIMLKLADHAHHILVFIEPANHAFSLPLCELVEKLDRANGRRMQLFLSKSDLITEDERTRIVSSISQSLAERIKGRTLDLRPLSLPGHQKTATDANALSLICETIESAVNNRVQANRSQLEDDLGKVTRAAEAAVSTLGGRRKRFRIATVAFVIVIVYYIAATQMEDVVFFQGLNLVALVTFIIWIITWLLNPNGSDLKIITGYLNTTARTAKMKLGQYFEQLTNPDE